MYHEFFRLSTQAGKNRNALTFFTDKLLETLQIALDGAKRLRQSVSAPLLFDDLGRSRGTGGAVAFEKLAGTSNGIALFMEQGLDFQDEFDIIAPIEPLFGTGTFRFDVLELRLPIAQNMGRYLRQFADFTNLKVKLVGYVELHMTSVTPCIDDEPAG